MRPMSVRAFLLTSLFVLILLALVSGGGTQAQVNQRLYIPLGLRNAPAVDAAPTATASATPQRSNTPTVSPTAGPGSTATLTATASPPVAASATPGTGATPAGLTVCTVSNVVDGDTANVVGCADAGLIRFILIDTPEVFGGAECFGREASDYTKAILTVGAVVGLERDVSNTDSFGRLLRYVWVNGEMLNWRLVYDGYAALAVYPPDTKHQATIAAAEQAAKAASRGLWPICGGVDTAATATPTGGQATSTRTATAIPLGTSTPTPTTASAPTLTATATTTTCGGANATITALDKVGEVVTVTGSGTMTDWYVISETGSQRFDFPSGFVLTGSVQVKSGTGQFSNTSSALWWTTANVWNNSSNDDALLFNCAGTQVSRFDDGQ